MRAIFVASAILLSCTTASSQTTVDSFNPGANGAVRAIALQPDGKILAGGNFTRIGGGGSGTTTRNRIARLNADGSVDSTFDPGANNDVIAFAVQPDGKIVVGGIFTTMGGGGTGTTTRNRIARLNADGSLDASFHPGANSAVQALALQQDGKILVAGSFTTLGGGGTGTTTRNYIGRLNVDGSLDTAFNPGADDFMTAIAVQSDGRILLGGNFFKLGGGTATTSRTFLGRVNADGSLDTTYDPAPNSAVYAIVIQPDGRAVVGGGFTRFGSLSTGFTRRNLARLSTAGAIDTSFDPGTNGNVYALALQPDGKIVVGGSFSGVGGGTGTTSRSDLARINSDGTVDTDFNPGANGILGIDDLLLQTNGKIVVTGDFTRLGGGGSGTTDRNQIGRLNSDAPLPTMSLDKTTLTFAAASTGAAFTSATSAQAVRLSQSGVGTVSWTASSSASWLTVSPAAGTGPAALNVSVQFAGGLSSTQTATITLTFSDAANASGSIAVTLNIVPTTGTAPPHGAFDTPVDGATGVAGSIPVTGWAVDDIEVTRVRILRDPVAGEPAGLVFIGDAVLVDGARPDVQASFPSLPRNSRAGWGYLMLTIFLPNLGNGTFRLHAIADDADGHSTTLGTRTITCANSTATAPFGAIDTPGQGETVTTASYNNFGWVLSPGTRRSDPPSGGAVQVVIDGVLGVTPAGWVSRSDLDALFPVAQFSGVGSALGVATLNTAALTNGVHTISWLVTDNQGTASGIGSRYFTVANSALTLAPDLRLPAMTVAPARSVAGRRGYAADAPYQTFAAGADERITIQSEEIDRIELQLGAPGAGVRSGETFTGHLRLGNALHPLPAGSALDRNTGEFTWQPGVGFVGSYDLVFARWNEEKAVERHEVRVVLNPKGSNRSGPQTIIDLPSAGATVTGPFVLAGWAADLDAVVGAGVNTVHVWAYPVNARGGYDDPIWIGVAGFGGARPDVAAVYGDRFRDTGYGITVPGLAPGTYDLAVFAHSTVKRGFVPARTVRVMVR